MWLVAKRDPETSCLDILLKYWYFYKNKGFDKLISFSMKHEDYEDTEVIVHNSGWCFWIPPMTTFTYCGLDFTYWPWDIQNCVVTFGSWTRSGWELDIHNRDRSNVWMTLIFIYWLILLTRSHIGSFSLYIYI